MAGGSKASRKGGGKGGGSSRSRDPRMFGQGHTSEGCTAKSGKKKSATSSSRVGGGGGGGLRAFSSSANRAVGGSFDLTASDDDDVSFHGGASAGGNHYPATYAYAAPEPDDDGLGKLAQSTLKQAMVGRLTRNANSKDLSFHPKELELMLEAMIKHRDELLTYALLAEDASASDDGGTLPMLLSDALPESLSKKMKGKAKMADILAETYFVYERMARSGITLPSHHSPLGKALQKFSATMVRVRNFCAHELAVEQTKKKALKSEPISGKNNVYIVIFVSSNALC